MRRLAVALLALSLPLSAAAQDDVSRAKTAPGKKADLKKPFDGPRAGFVLPDVTGFVPALGGKQAAKAERVTRVDVTVTSEDVGKLGATTEDAPWRGLTLPKAGPAGNTPVIDLREVRVKLLIYGADGRPLLKSAPGATVVIKIGATTYPSFDALAQAIARVPADAPTILDVRGSVPAAHAITALAILLNAGRVPTLAAEEFAVDDPRPGEGPVLDALRKEAAKAKKDSGGLPLIGVRVRGDARASWRSLTRVLDAASRANIRRVTFAANAGDVEIDLFPPGRGGVVIAKREIKPQEYDEELKRDMHKTPKINAPDVVEKPIIILEEEVEVTEDVPKGTQLSGKNLDSTSVVDAYGVGGGAAGSYGMRWGKGILAKEGGGEDTEAAVTAALLWLKKHQSPDGSWSASGFTKQCQQGACKGTTPWKAHNVPGDERYNVGVTALALLAYAGNGHTHRFGTWKRTVSRALNWLKRQQKEDGSIGFDKAETIYNHALATQALCELYAISRDFTLKRYAQKGVEFILEAQNPMLGWKYGVKTGRNDTLVTGRMVLALRAGKDAGLPVPEAAFDGALAWFQRVTDAKGSVGYETPGGGSSFLGANDGKFDQMPVSTAVSVYCRILLGQRRDTDSIVKGANLLREKVPAWDKRGKSVNFYYWHTGSLAMFQVGGDRWTSWNKAMKLALLPKQNTQGCSKGSWEPVGEWCLSGGRVYATALNAMTLETYYRFARVPDKK